MSSSPGPFECLPPTWQWFDPHRESSTRPLINGTQLPITAKHPDPAPSPLPPWLDLPSDQSPKLYTLVFPYSVSQAKLPTIVHSTNGQDQIGRRSNIHLLLGLKKRGFGLGHINAFGGKPILLSTSPPLDDDHVIESPLDCALRELAEETSIELDQHVVSSTLKAHGRLLIHASHPSASVEDKFANELSLLYIFSLPLDHDQLVAAKETDEMCPHIYPLNNLPFQDMHPESSLLIDLIFGPRNAHHQQLPSPAYFFDARIDYQGVTDAMSSGEQGRASQATAVRTCRRRIARRWSVNFYDSPPAQ